MNGVPRSSHTFKQHESVLAEQDQGFLASMTVEETLRVHCMLQRPGFAESDPCTKNSVMDALLQLVGLYSVRTSTVRVRLQAVGLWSAIRAPAGHLSGAASISR